VSAVRVDLKEFLVLYVDDEASNRVVFEHAFKDLFRVSLASSADEALKKMDLEVPAVVVSDQRMPGMPGAEFLAEVKRRHPDVERVFLTAYPDPGPMLDAINRVGASRFLVKPWDKREMTGVLAGAIESYRLRQEVKRLQLQMIELQQFSTVGTITASVAHDMSSPLTVIASNAERLKELSMLMLSLRNRTAALGGWKLEELEAADELPAISRELYDASNYILSLLQGIRSLARPTGEDEATDPRTAMSFATKLVRVMVSEKRGRLDSTMTPLPKVRIPPTHLSQVLVNLLSNAADALETTSDKRLVTLNALHEKENACVRFSVTDTGVGMRKDVLQRAGVERVTTKPLNQGTGLGLTIVRELIQRAGGRMEIQSEEGVGTKIDFWIPLSKEQ
jgi:two-component system NtrC family sensor kinase